MISFESPDLDRLVADFGSAGARVRPAVRAVVVRGAVNIKKAAKAAAPNPHFAGLYINSITFDVVETGDTVTAEIGPDKNKPQGALGNLLEFGGSKWPPHPHLVPAWEAEIEPTERWVGEVAGQVLE